MKILFSTDLHGNSFKYQKLIQLSNDYDILIIGADILPKNSLDVHQAQYYFVQNFLPIFFSKIKIPIIIDFGNDDHKYFYKDFQKMIKRFNHVFISHLNEVIINDISFIGMHYVPDYPFGLKDWCRKDNEDYVVDPIQYGTPCISSNNGYQTIFNLYTYFNERFSIEENLKRLSESSKQKVIYLFHSPPRTLGLDICADGRAVGSRATTKFIEKEQPYACLSGHIHESFDMTDIFYNTINKTICVQPGQSQDNDLVYCSFNTDNIEETIERKVI